MRKIWVDADACPVKVKEAIAQLGTEFKTPIYLVASLNHQLAEYPGAKVIYVDPEAEAVDLQIMGQVQVGDIVVTQDFGLAAMVLAKRASCISPRGILYLDERIESLLEQRHAAAQFRRRGGRTKGPTAFSQEDARRFAVGLRGLLAETGETDGTT